MLDATWIRQYQQPEVAAAVAVAGSPGLRSIGSLVIDALIRRIQPELIAELYSTHFPLVYQTKPSYASHHRLPGIGGVAVEAGAPVSPRVQFYFHPTPPLIITQGYHANFHGQYEVAERVLDLYERLQVQRVIVVAGYGLQGAAVCGAATTAALMEELKTRYGVDVGYVGPFYGFSGLVFGLAQRRGLDAVCLFSQTEPNPDFPESPDEAAAATLLRKLAHLLDLPVDLLGDID